LGGDLAHPILAGDNLDNDNDNDNDNEDVAEGNCSGGTFPLIGSMCV
jgi:hypothetical protein